MFPYPSGKLHVGHVRNYTMGDLVARYRRAQGFNVLHPMGWDAFGLPAENAAIAGNIHPAIWTDENIATMRGQLQRMGFAYDWSREIATCHPEYYRHEQKMFLDFLAAGLAYRKESWVNWDPVENTVLANEQVIDGRGWRSGALVEKRLLAQWFLRITAFSEELLDALEDARPLAGAGAADAGELDRPLGRRPRRCSRSPGSDERDRGLHDPAGHAVRRLVPGAVAASSAGAAAGGERSGAGRVHRRMRPARHQRGGHRGGREARLPHRRSKPCTRSTETRRVPVYVANFVLMEYGTGAIFGCPAHDQRDLDFARKYGLPVIPVVLPPGADPATFADRRHRLCRGRGRVQFRFPRTGCRSPRRSARPASGSRSWARRTRTIAYRLRDWGVSRQRYWGCPIPVIHCPDCGIVPVPEDDLPVELPQDVIFDQPGNPLDHHPTWKHVNCPYCNSPATRETDTFDTFFESSWYFLRFCSARAPVAFDREAAEYWMPVDQYIGGVEHAVLHLLYSRFFTRALEAVRLYRPRRAVRRPVHPGHGIAPDLSERRRGMAVSRRRSTPTATAG